MIQFECPHCQSVLRVADSFMGQRGRCPQCQQAVLVPTPAGLTSAATPTAMPTATPVATTQPTAAPVSREEPPENSLFAAISQPETSIRQDDPLLSLSRRSRSRNSGAVITGLVFLLLAIAAGGGVYYFLQPRMNGELSTQVVSEIPLKSRVIPLSQLGDPRLFESFLEEQSGERLNILSQQLRTSVEPVQQGLMITANPTPEFELYRVDVLSNPALKAYFVQHQQKLTAEHEHLISLTAQKLVGKSTAELDEIRRSPPDLQYYRDQLLLPTVAGLLGNRLAAYIQQTPYHCIGYDDRDRLYFALPAGTRTFEIRERPLKPGATPFFPEQLHFTVSLAPENSSPADDLPLEETTEATTPDTPDNPETKPEDTPATETPTEPTENNPAPQSEAMSTEAM